MSESGWTDRAYEAIAHLVGARTGLVFASNRRDDAEAGIRRAMSKAALSDVGQYLALLEQGAAALDALIAELTVGETYFLREAAHFEFIRREVLPDLLKRRGPAHVLRVWSAGCASGEEAYSLAIVLDEAGVLQRAQVLGSDISRPALARAQEASYGPWSLRGVDDGIVRRYFLHVGGRQVLDQRIKKAVSFHYLNLAQDVYPSLASGTWGMDVILCRNVLIYFDRETVKHVAERLFRSLAPGGWLIAGPSDPPLSELAPFETVVTRDGVFYRHGREGHREFRSTASPGWEPTVIPPDGRWPKQDEPPPGPPEPPSDVAAAAPSPAIASPPDSLALAREALATGDYERALGLSRDEPGPESAEIAVRACANLDGTEAALELVATATKRYALSSELHFLHAVLLLDVGRLDDAAQALRRVLYLDQSLAMAHFVLGTLLSRRGEVAGARRAYGTAAELAGARSPDEPVPLGDGERAGRLALAARTQAELLHEEGAS